jgi:putative SOS response-associated peptidase YedK
MCGRYVRKSTRREIAAWFGVEPGDEDPYTEEWVASYNVAPQTFQPVVRLNRETGMREIALMRWGLIPYWAKDAKIGYSTINAKAETVATAPAFREAFKRRRCLVPADAFYEWQKLDPKYKQPFAIALASREPYGFAGLWERWKDPVTREWLETFSIITTDPNQVVAPLHNRMPVIIERKDYARWLGAPDFLPEAPTRATCAAFIKESRMKIREANEVDRKSGGGDSSQPPLDLLRPFPAEQMIAWKVDKAVGNVGNDAAQLLESPPEEPMLGFVADTQQ